MAVSEADDVEVAPLRTYYLRNAVRVVNRESPLILRNNLSRATLCAGDQSKENRRVGTRTDLAIDVAVDAEPVFRRMASRSGAVSVVNDIESSAAIVTDRPESARQIVRDGRYALVMNPYGLSTEVRHELASSKRAMPAHVTRFLPAVRQVRQSLDAGQLGEPGLLRIHRWEESLQNRVDRLVGELDLAVWLFGSLPSEIYAVERPGYLQAHAGFPGGGMALIDLDGSVPSGNAYYSLSLIGSAGAAYADDHRNMNLLLGVEGTQAVRVSQGDTGLFHLVDEFAQAVQRGDDFSSLWHETESAIQVFNEVGRAARTQEVIVVGDRRA